MSTQLEFTQAMTDFKVMFPDMDADVIEAVLRANNGAVDTTIDHLLAMSADNETSAPDQKASGVVSESSKDNLDQPPAYTGQPPSYQQAMTKTGDEAVTDDLINLGATSLPAAVATAQSQIGSPPKLQTSSEASALSLLSDFANLDTSGSGEGGAGATFSSPGGDSKQSVTNVSEVKHAYSHPIRQEAEEQQFQSVR